MGKHKDKTFQFRVSEELWDNVEEVAEQRGISLSVLARAFFRRFSRQPDEAIEGLDLAEDEDRADYDHAHARKVRRR